MQQSGKTVVPSGGSLKSIQNNCSVSPGRQNNNLNPKDKKNNRQKELCTNSSSFSDWIDPSREEREEAKAKNLSGEKGKIIRRTDRNPKRCCINSTSSGYSSHSPPLSGGSLSSIYWQGSGVHQNLSGSPKTGALIPQHYRSIGIHRHLHHCRNASYCSSSCSPRPGRNVNCSNGVQSQQNLPNSNLSVIHEAETIPRPIWPLMGNEEEESNFLQRPEMPDCHLSNVLSSREDSSQGVYSCCDNCCASCVSQNVSGSTTASSARQVLLELSRTLNSVIEAETDLSAEEILRDISLTVARGIRANESPSSAICEDYTYRLSSSSSSGGGKESSVGVNPVNLRVYGKPKWLRVPVSSRSSSHCPYEVKNLIASGPRIIGEGEGLRNENPRNVSKTVAPAVFIVPQSNTIYPNALNAYRNKNSNVDECKSDRKKDVGTQHFEQTKRNQSIGRNVANCGDKCVAGEPVYSTQLDGSDESSSYGAIGDQTDKTRWNEATKVFDRHLDFTLDGNRAERLGRAIAKAKRKRQWCRGITAVFGLVFFVLSVVVVSLSVTRGRKVFGSM